MLGFYGNKPYNSGSGTGSPPIIRLGLWEDQVSRADGVTLTAFTVLRAQGSFKTYTSSQHWYGFPEHVVIPC